MKCRKIFFRILEFFFGNGEGDLEMNEEIMGIDVENPFEYYNTNNINEIPEHLRKQGERK